MNEYISIGSLAVLVIGVLIKTSVDLQKKPSYRDVENDYQRKDVCNEIHKSVDMRLERIETGIDKLLSRNGIAK